MPTLNIEGQSVQVDDSFLKLSPEQQNATVDEIAKTLKPQSEVTASGMAKQFGVEAARSAIGLAGAPADLAGLAAKGYDYLRGGNVADTIKPFTNMLGSENLQKQVEGYTGEFRKPQNRAEEIAGTFGSYAPLVASGPGGIVRKVATNIVAPAAGELVAKEAAKGTAFEPYAPVVGAVAGGAIGSKLGRALANNQPAIDKAAAQVKTAAQDTYNASTAKNVATPIPQSAIDNLANDLRTTLHNKGAGPSVADKVDAAIGEMVGPSPKQPSAMSVLQAEMNREPIPVAPAKPRDVSDLVAARLTMKNLLGSPDSNKAGAAIALDKINAAIEKYSPGTMAELKRADKDYAAVKAVDALDKKLARADLQAAGEHSGMNLGNKIRQNVRQMLQSNDGQRYLSDPNKASLEKVVRGTLPQNTLRTISNLLGGGGGLGATMLGAVGAGAVGESAGHPEFGLAPVLGFGLRGMSNRLTLRQAQKAAAEIISRSPTASKNPQILQALRQPNNPFSQAILRAIIAGQAQPATGLLGY